MRSPSCGESVCKTARKKVALPPMEPIGGSDAGANHRRTECGAGLAVLWLGKCRSAVLHESPQACTAIVWWLRGGGLKQAALSERVPLNPLTPLLCQLSVVKLNLYEVSALTMPLL